LLISDAQNWDAVGSSIYIANPILVRLNVSQKTILKEEKE